MLSHMRANTSLFGHILGHNPEINGYYEIHIGYYSWKSLIRQKLKYLENHHFKANSKYLFDKVLHNEHYINCKAIKNAKVIISLRNPEETIPSIINLYKNINSSHHYATTQGAAEYYKNRLNTLLQYSEELKYRFIYIDANDIKNNTAITFQLLEQELTLQHPLSAEYKIQTLTGIGASGDNSEALKTGKILPSKTSTKDIYIEPKLNQHYIQIRKQIIENAKHSL